MKGSSWKVRHQRRLFERYLVTARKKVFTGGLLQDKGVYAIYYDATESYCEHRMPYYKRRASKYGNDRITRKDLRIAAESVAVCELLEQQNPKLRGHRCGGTRSHMPNAVIGARQYLEESTS